MLYRIRTGGLSAVQVAEVHRPFTGLSGKRLMLVERSPAIKTLSFLFTVEMGVSESVILMEAINAGREIARNQNTELFIHGRDGCIRERDSYGSEPFPPKG